MALEKKEVGLVVAGVLSALFAVFLSTSPMAKHTHSPKSLVAPTAEQLQTSSYFQSNRSMWLHYRTAFPASMPPKAVVFVCHGFAEHTAREGYRRLSSALKNAGYAVFLLDHQGHGLSNGDKAYFEKFDHLVDDYVHFMRHVVHAFNSSIPLTTPKFLFGHSMGGAVSFLVSQRLSGEPASPVSLTGTVLSGPLFRLPNDDLVLQAFAHAASSLVPKLVVAHINATQVSRNATAVKNYVEDPLINRNVYARTAHNLFNATRHIAAHAGEVTWPFLIVHGDHDEMCLLEGSRAVHDQAKSTDKTLKTYPGMFHEPFEDELASAVLSDVVAWLNARVPA